MTAYVLGFRFKGLPVMGAAEVALIEKTKPHWQAGKLNGIGGKIEVSDLEQVRDSLAHSYQIAMAREFREETGLDTKPQEWRKFGTLHHGDNCVFLLVSFAKWDEALLQTTEEKPMWVPTMLLRMMPIMDNLLWMIPMALDKDKVAAEVIDPTPVPVKKEEVTA
jgi:8-oxo-dGTP diphosphatase